MEEGFKALASGIALAIEIAATLIIAAGAIQAMLGAAGALVDRHSKVRRREVWLEFAVWLLLGLEFELAADIIRTAIAPTWTEVGQLGSIAAIRTFLNYFLEKDLERYAEPAEARRIENAPREAVSTTG